MLPVEIQKAEILDWWETERDHISRALPDRLPELFYRVDQTIDGMPVRALMRRGKFHSEQIEPIVVEWLEKLYRELTHDLDNSFRSSLETVEGGGPLDSWSYGEAATAGAAIAVSAAPIAGIPFFAGGIASAGVTILGVTVGGGALLAFPVAALAGSAVLFAAGPAARGKAVSHLKSRFKATVHSAIETRVLGNTEEPVVPSLKGTLLGELRGVTLQRIEMVK
ncbi:hypothetical protein [Sulfitobacter mediterraneus]|uniref:hypothetical protein n=1 Tax=Sulfitobacter mediterraneus TaxID=83219 RepID=UPI0021A972F6|nr:hypothetical protein [Sulfitobacter mediterraneus]UWR10906.1 hypothetical protein K3753_16900 [Sulfitobacter mediterraneus]